LANDVDPTCARHVVSAFQAQRMMKIGVGGKMKTSRLVASKTNGVKPAGAPGDGLLLVSKGLQRELPIKTCFLPRPMLHTIARRFAAMKMEASARYNSA